MSIYPIRGEAIAWMRVVEDRGMPVIEIALGDPLRPVDVAHVHISDARGLGNRMLQLTEEWRAGRGEAAG